MSLFQQIEGDVAVLSQNGVYKQVDVYERDGALYAKHGGGFIRLYADGATSQSKVRLDVLHFEGPLFKDALGRLFCHDKAKGVRALDSNNQQKLLGIAGPTE